MSDAPSKTCETPDQRNPLPKAAQVVIIGGGVIGCSIAYHLSRLGWHDILLFERLRLTHGATWHAAGLVGQLRSSSNLTRLMRYSAELYGELERETGQATGWRRVGSLRLAASAERWLELKRSATMARGFGLGIELVSPQEAATLFPLLDPRGLIGAAWIDSDGYVDPTSLTMALAAGARARGVRIIEKMPVTALLCQGRRVKAVVTAAGTVQTEVVVNATGMWGSEVAALAGERLPVCAVEHQYLVTSKSARVPDGLPTLRDPDARFYVKPEPGALCVGGWESRTVPFGARGIPADFGPELLPPNLDRFAEYGTDAAARIPFLDEAGMRELVNGPIPITADGEPIMGLSPEHDNFYVCCGFTSGIAAAGGAGRMLANWIAEGDPGMDLWPFDVRRFGHPQRVPRFLLERAIESYARYYAIAYPFDEPTSARGARRSPLHELLLTRGAVYGTKFAWERPNHFGSVDATGDPPSWARGPSFAQIGEEHRAVRERVALIDMSSFSKFELAGPGALVLLQRLAGNDLDRPVGSIVYTQLLNQRGGIEADVTITRLAEDRFYFVTGSALGVRDRSVLQRHLPLDRSVEIIDHTSARAVINLCGPRAREVLAALADAPLASDEFPYMTGREIDLGLAPVLALRVTYVGELGWELHVPTEYALWLFETLRSAGEPFGITDVGYRAIQSLRLEKHHLAWGADITPDHNPYEAGLGFCVAADKPGDFLAREALAEVRRRGLAQRLSWFSAPGEIPMYGGEVVWAGGRPLGSARSAGYGYTVGHNLLCAYIAASDLGRDDYEIEVMGERYPLSPQSRPPYDPERERPRA
ncbi:MAG: GcvT family protein [Proteobacteria bacterium]|nr:GcvT family protein [Pseudomonadota bacterium]